MKINKDSVLIGSDFEMFLMDENGKVISAIPFIDAGKRFPEQTQRHGCCIQHDGILAECNVPPVKLDEHASFWENIQYVKGYIEGKFAKEQGLILVCCPSSEIDEDQLQHPEALESGCSPSFNAWLDGEMNESCGFDGSRLRTCGKNVCHLL